MFIDLLRSRRSIRQFTEQKLSPQQIDLLKEVVVRAPTSQGKNPWQFIFVTNPEIIQQLSQAKTKGAAFLANCPLAVVVCADTSCSDVWQEDCAIASICLQLACTDLGLGSCWAQIRLRSRPDGSSASNFLSSLLELPANLEVDNIIGIGYSAENKAGHPNTELPWSHIREIA
ncbi:MAG: nitroreductase family protein [Desulfuromonas sp.]|nr:nitroreductase family protein [Desulfuromonas sp.]